MYTYTFCYKEVLYTDFFYVCALLVHIYMYVEPKEENT